MKLNRQSFARLLSVGATLLIIASRALADAPTTQRSIFDFGDDDPPQTTPAPSDHNPAKAPPSPAALHSAEIISIQRHAIEPIRPKTNITPVVKIPVLK